MMSGNHNNKNQAMNRPETQAGAIGENSVHSQQAQISSEFSASNDGHQQVQVYERILRPLLSLMNWPGHERHIVESLPHLQDIENMQNFRMVLDHLGFATERKHIKVLKSLGFSFPLITELSTGPFIIESIDNEGRFQGFDGGEWRALTAEETASIKYVTLIQFKEERDDEKQTKSWFFTSLRELKKPISATLFLTFLANLLTLATPIFTMNVYNKVIGSRALDTLFFFLFAVLFALAMEVFVRRERGKIIAYIGARLDAALSNEALKKVLTLPISMTENASINKQIVQFRQFESIRDLVTGNLASSFLDLPFIFIFLAVIATLSGWLVVVPFTLLLIFATLAALTLPEIRRRSIRSGIERARFNRQSMELTSKMQSIRELGAEDLWLARHSQSLHVSSHAMFHSRFFDTIMQSLAQILVLVAGLATISWGALMVLDGDLDIGGLIAVMMIIWRILTPIQVAFLSLNKIGQLKKTIQQIDRLMTMPAEKRFKGKPNSLRKFEGDIFVDGIAFRYGPKFEPALKGLSLHIKPGEVLAISGSTGAGKSTLLKLIMGLYHPQAGRVSIDGINIQQLDVGEIRSNIGYMPPVPKMFYGTLEQNLRLANPAATHEEMYQALQMAGIGPDDRLLKDGLKRPLREESNDLSESELARIALARAYLVRGPIILLDDPGTYLDHQSDKHFVKQIKALQGNKTVILITNRPSHITACNRIIQIHAGIITADMTIDEYLSVSRAINK